MNAPAQNLPAGGFRPLPDQELLLRAALLPGSEAREAWQDWRGRVDFEALDPGSFRLLPLVLHNLQGQLAEEPLLPRLKGIHRHFWYRNQLFLHQMGEVLEALEGAGVACLVLKGAALATRYYPAPALRPMADLDLLIRPADLPRALGCLREGAWEPIYFGDYAPLTPSYLSYATAHGFRQAGERELDLHWQLLSGCPGAGCDDGFWERAVPLTLQGRSGRTLDATDLLFHVCVHGAAWNPLPALRWVADAWMILRQGSPDWQRLLAEARRHQVLPALRETLGYLAATFRAPVPETFLRELQREPVPAAQEREFAAEQIPLHQRGAGLELWLAYRRYRRWVSREKVPAGPVSYLRVLQHTAKRPSLWELWGYALARARARRRGADDGFGPKRPEVTTGSGR